jgi:excisionase family DNA binding protein
MSDLIKMDDKKQTYMTVKQIAELCNVTSKTILEWIKNTPLHFVKVENGVFIGN